MEPIRQKLLWVTFVLVLVVMVHFGLSGCGLIFGGPDDDTDDDASGDDDAVETWTPDVTPIEGTYELSGTVSYEYVPYDHKYGGLDYSTTYSRPIRGATVYLVDALQRQPIDHIVSDEEGRYSFSWEGGNYVVLWVYAETTEPPLQVEDNTHKDAIWVVESQRIDAVETNEFDYLATTGWTGTSYKAERAAAPFAILDACYAAGHRFLDETEPPPDLPFLRINWSPNNRPEDGDKSAGQISTSHWDQSELYILGKADTDTDEFDSHVIIHEWGHYFESEVGRSDSIGGAHTTGDVLDPRVAFSEGWGNALGAMILDPDSVYTDSMGSQQASGFEFDLQDNDISARYNPGWWSEETIQAILYDLYDGKDESYDETELGLNPIYLAQIGDQKTTRSLTSLFSFISTLKGLNPDITAEIDDLVTYHTANSSLGIDIINDDWATGETHDAGLTGALPLYKEVEIGDRITITLNGGYDFNKLAQNRYVAFEGDGTTVTVSSTCSHDIDLYVFREGNYVAWENTDSGDESLQFRTNSGETYVLNVMGFYDKDADYDATIEITN